MRRTISILLLFIVSCGVSTFARQTAETRKADSPEAAVVNFYKWYIHALNQNKDPFARQRRILKEYVTLRLIREIDRMVKGPDGLDGDYFLDAQDWDKEWEQNISVSETKVDGQRATTTVLLTGPQVGKRKLQISLQQQTGQWKIDRVKNLE